MNWYAIQTKPRGEAEAELNLQRQDFQVYLPRIQVSKSQRGRRQKVIEPLFPRYLFVQVDPMVTDIAPIRSTRGVSGLVKFGNIPAVVPDAVIAALQAQDDAAAGCYLPEVEAFSSGDRVAVTEGPFAGMQGIFEACSSEERVFVLLEILGQESRCSLQADQLSRVA